MAATDRIVVDPKVMLGKPVIRGTRIPVELIVRKLGEGATEADLRIAAAGSAGACGGEGASPETLSKHAAVLRYGRPSTEEPAMVSVYRACISAAVLAALVAASTPTPVRAGGHQARRNGKLVDC